MRARPSAATDRARTKHHALFRSRPSHSLAVLLGTVALSARADDYDYTYGSDARAFAMGGVGLAFTRGQNNAQSYNPASLGFASKSFDFYVPSVSVRADGAISSSKAYDFLYNGLRQRDVTGLFQRYATKDSVFGLNANAGFRFGSFEVLVGGVGKARLQPNGALSSWAGSGANLSSVPLNAGADLLAAGYLELPSIAYAFKLPVGTQKGDNKRGYDNSIGVRVRVLQSFYTRYIANAGTVASGTDAIKAPELGGKDFLKKTGVGADLGFLARPRAGKGFNFALVGNNLVKPGSKFTAFNSGLAGYNGRVGSGDKFDLLQTTVSLGTAYEAGGLTFGADLMDISGATRPLDFRFGGEQRFGKGFALRAGYSSGTGATIGVGIFGFDFAAAQRLPLEVNKTLKF